jgi:hypothetical protein
MKKKLLLLILPMLFLATSSNAQSKTWDFGNDTQTWPLNAGIGNSPIVKDNLGLYPTASNTNFGAITANVASFTDGFTSVNRFQMNGAGFPAGAFQAMPAQRYLFIDVSGACTVKVWFKTGSNGAVRTMYVSNGTASIASETTNTGANADLVILTANYTGPAGRLYIYGDTACNLYKVTVTGATVNTTLATNNFQNSSNVKVLTNGNKISVTNVTSDSKIEVFSMTGALVKTIKTSSDTDFQLETSGLYIVNVVSAEGEKSVKVTVK